MSHYIVIQSSKKISVRDYIVAIKFAKSYPDTMFAEGLNQWWPVTGKQIYSDYVRSIHERINARCGESWRNFTTQKEIEEKRDSLMLQDWLQKRLICRRLNTPKLNARLQHLLYKED
jgi:hypothetical protein